MAVDRVDVIVCTNSDGAYLGAALDSVEQQTWPHWSVTVVDDGSEHPEALARAVSGHDRVRIVRQEHRGLPAARNTGLRATDAGWITFLDDDDIWDPRRLELLVAALEDAGGRAIAAYSGGWNIDPAGRSIGYEWGASRTPSEDMIRGRVDFPRLFTLLADRTAIDAAGPFDETYSIAEDNEFMLRFLSVGELVAVPERLVGYRRHDRNMTVTAPRMGPDPSIRLLTAGMARARAAGDRRMHGWIRENRRRYIRTRARLEASDALHDLREGRIRMSARKMARAVLSSPPGAVQALARKARTAGSRLVGRRS